MVKGKQNVPTIEQFEASRANKVSLGVVVKGKEIYEGTAKLVNGVPVEIDGELQKWEDAYYIDCSWLGGSHKFKFDRKTYDDVKIGSTYEFVGQINVKSFKDSTKTMLVVEPLELKYLF